MFFTVPNSIFLYSLLQTLLKEHCKKQGRCVWQHKSDPHMQYYSFPKSALRVKSALDLHMQTGLPQPSSSHVSMPSQYRLKMVYLPFMHLHTNAVQSAAIDFSNPKWLGTGVIEGPPSPISYLFIKISYGSPLWGFPILTDE